MGSAEPAGGSVRCWKDSFISVDVETTGLFQDARIVEVAFAWFEDRRLTRTFSTLINPGDIDWNAPDVRSALEVNRIEPSQLADAPTFEQLMRCFMIKLGRDPWVAHNADFDLRMFGQERRRLEASTGVSWAPYVPRPAAKLDTMLLAYHIVQGLDSYKLSRVAEAMHVMVEPTHRAMADAKACGYVMLELADRLPDELVAVQNVQHLAKRAWLQHKEKRKHEPV